MIELKIQFTDHCIGLHVFDLLQASLLQDEKIKLHLGPLDASSRCDALVVSSKKELCWDRFTHASKIFFCNGDEPTAVANEQIKSHLGDKNTWLICNALLTDDHPLLEHVIFRSNDLTITRQYWTNGIFPMWHENQRHRSTTKSCNFWAINGANRSWRHHVFTNLRKKIPDLDFYSKISTVIHETNDAWWESEHDEFFRSAVNEMYPVSRNVSTSYYDNSTRIVTNSRVIGLPQEGFVPPGYSIMPQYWQSKCVIFPESGWQNCELNITEKIAKCFFAKCIPFPVGGAKINQLYNQLGFRTGWNLLPADMQAYDDELDHFKRHALMTEAVEYLYNHPELLDSDHARSIVAENLVNFLTDQSDSFSINQLRNIFSL